MARRFASTTEQEIEKLQTTKRLGKQKLEELFHEYHSETGRQEGHKC